MKKTILVFRVGQLGDTLVSLPALQLIRESNVGSKIVLLTERNDSKLNHVLSWDVIRPTGWVDDVVFYKPEKQLRKILSLFSLYKNLKKYNIDIVYDLSPERSRYQLIRDKIIFKVTTRARKILQGVVLPKQGKINGKLPTIEAEWLRLLKIVDPDYMYKNNFTLPPTVLGYPSSVLKATERPNVMIGLGLASKMPAKVWALENYLLVCNKLNQQIDNLTFYLFGSKAESDYAEKIRKQYSGVMHNVCGKLSIYESATLLKECNLYIGNDTGTMHLAALAGTKCLALFSARDYPGQWYPLGNQNTILRKQVECEGCMLEVCDKNNMCLNNITCQEVFDNAIEILQ